MSPDTFSQRPNIRPLFHHLENVTAPSKTGFKGTVKGIEPSRHVGKEERRHHTYSAPKRYVVIFLKRYKGTEQLKGN